MFARLLAVTRGVGSLTAPGGPRGVGGLLGGDGAVGTDGAGGAGAAGGQAAQGEGKRPRGDKRPRGCRPFWRQCTPPAMGPAALSAVTWEPVALALDRAARAPLDSPLCEHPTCPTS